MPVRALVLYMTRAVAGRHESNPYPSKTAMSSLSTTLRIFFSDRTNLVSLLPVALLITLVALLAVDVLFWDEWMIWSKLLEDVDHGLPSLADMLAQQNEQRNFAARLFGLVFMPMCGLNRFCEYGVTIALTFGNWLMVRSMWKNTRDYFQLRGGTWLPLFFSILLFSTIQWQVFTMGANTSIALTVGCLLLGALLLQKGRLEAWRVMLLILVGWLGSFNFANGLFYWILMTPLFLLAHEDKRRIYAALAVFLIAGALAWVLYFSGYVKPPHHPPLTYSLSKPLYFLGFFLSYVGAPLVTDKNLLVLALVFGALALGLFLRLLWVYWRRDRAALTVLAPWLVLGVFALMSNGATTLGRAGLGVDHALESRYTAFGNMFWLCFLALWAVGRERLPFSSAPRWISRYLPAALCVFIVGSVLSVIVMYNRVPRFEKGRAELYRLEDNKALAGILPDPNYLRHILPIFMRHRVGPYRDVKDFSEYTPYHGEPDAAGAVESVTTLQPGGDVPSGVQLGGHAFDPESNKPAKRVLFASGGTIIFEARPLTDGSFEVLIPSDYLPQADPDSDYSAAIMPLAVFGNDMMAPLSMPEPILDMPRPWYPPFVVNNFFYSQ